MESHFLSNPWLHPRARSAFTSPMAMPDRRQAESSFNNPPRKVVSVPVRFISSEKTQSDSARKIQKIFRGFLARKSLKKVLSIRDEVNEIERKISRAEVVESMRGDPKERLRINEFLMSLLLKLDSVTGINTCVKDCRKSVIKRIIRLQELVDSMADEIFEDIMSKSTYQLSETELQDRSVDSEHPVEETEDSPSAATDRHDSEAEFRKEECEDRVKDVPVDIVQKADDEVSSHEEVANLGLDSECFVEDEEILPETNDDSASDDRFHELIEGIGESKPNIAQIMEEKAESKEARGNPNLLVEDGEDEQKTEVLERLVDDNRRMMSLMMELCKKNTLQMGMLDSLSQRVDRLERAFVSERMRRRKKNPTELIVRSSPHPE